jgi:glycosyltransferase involved in cell wall biosynthesis
MQADAGIERILMTTDAVGGIFTYALSLANELARAGVDVHLATMGPAPSDEQRAHARAIPRLVLHESTFALEWMDEPWEDVARAGDWLRWLAHDVAPDVVQLNGYGHGALSFGAPTVVVAHSCVLSWWHAVYREHAPSRYERYERAVRLGLERATIVVAVSGAMRASLVRHYGPFPSHRPIFVVHNGLPHDNEDDPGRLASQDREPFVLACGRTWDIAKNIGALVRLAPRLPWPLRIAGSSGPEHLTTGDDRTHAEWLGWASPSDLRAAMGRAAIFAHPALYEPFGLAPLEAARAGAALVLGDIESLREIWDDAALFVDPRDDEAILRAIKLLAEDPALRARLADKARARARHPYSARRMAAEMLSVYRLAKSSRHGAPHAGRTTPQSVSRRSPPCV